MSKKLYSTGPVGDRRYTAGSKSPYRFRRLWQEQKGLCNSIARKPVCDNVVEGTGCKACVECRDYQNRAASRRRNDR